MFTTVESKFRGGCGFPNPDLSGNLGGGTAILGLWCVALDSSPEVISLQVCVFFGVRTHYHEYTDLIQFAANFKKKHVLSKAKF